MKVIKMKPKKRFGIQFREVLRVFSYVEVEAESKEDALEKFKDGEWIDETHTQEEINESIDSEPSLLDVEEIES